VDIDNIVFGGVGGVLRNGKVKLIRLELPHWSI
jgi:hypothetical protein